jgi:hypothetical protein
MFFVDREPVDYSSVIEEDLIHSCILKKNRLTIVELKGLEKLAELQKKKIGVVFVASADNQNTLKAFTSLTAPVDNIIFRCTYADEFRVSFILITM